MKNKLGDLNNHLFAQLERLNDEDLSGDALVQEIERSKAITEVSKEIVSNASLVLKAHIAMNNTLGASMPKMLEED